MKRSFGLDLAGYSTGSALAEAYKKNQGIHVDILVGHEFENKIEGTDELSKTVEAELRCIQHLLQSGHIYIDIPIDLQGLPHPKSPQYVWELAKRPIDKYFDGLPPLSSLIGSPVARMQYLWSLLKRRCGKDPLGTLIFETYPAASLKKSSLVNKGYKGKTTYSKSTWTGAPTTKEDEKSKNEKMAKILKHLSWTADEHFTLNHDEFDAAICALTGLGKQLKGDELQSEMNSKLKKKYAPPKGYVLLKEIPKKVILGRKYCQSRLARECAKLDPEFEKAMAEEGF
jgi:hypothetical protein